MHTRTWDVTVLTPEGALSDEQLATATGGDVMQDLQNIMHTLTRVLDMLQAMNMDRIRNL